MLNPLIRSLSPIEIPNSPPKNKKLKSKKGKLINPITSIKKVKFN